MVRLNRPAHSLDRPAPKAGLWFMGQFSLDSSDIIPGFDGKLKTQFGSFLKKIYSYPSLKTGRILYLLPYANSRVVLYR